VPPSRRWKVSIDYQWIGGVIDVVADVHDQVQESDESHKGCAEAPGPCPRGSLAPWNSPIRAALSKSGRRRT
jgi:hypothetical protein